MEIITDSAEIRRAVLQLQGGGDKLPASGVGLEGKKGPGPDAGRQDPVRLSAGGKGDAVGPKQRCDQVCGRDRSDIFNEQRHRYVFAGINDAVGWRATFLGENGTIRHQDGGVAGVVNDEGKVLVHLVVGIGHAD